MSHLPEKTAFQANLSEGTPGVFAPRGDSARFEFGAASHIGKVRGNNEDHYAISRRTRSREVLFTNVDAAPGQTLTEEHAYVLIVADGVGGRGFGELASELVLRTGWDLSDRATSWVMKFDPKEWETIRERILAYTTQIQEALVEYAQLDPKLAGMGTTWTCAYLMGADGVLGHVGDSRAYLYRAGALKQLSHDHTFAQELIDLGMPAEDTRRFKHVLTNSFGARGEPVRTQVERISLEDGDRLLLCTDGLSDMVSDAEIAEILGATPEPQRACDVLIDRALAAGGKDNVTVLLADIHLEPTDPTPPA